MLLLALSRWEAVFWKVTSATGFFTRWAKPYVRPGVQRSMGMYDTPEEAAVRIILYMCTGLAPPSPNKDRNKRGTGRRPRPERQRAARKASPSTPLAELPAQPPTPATLAAVGVYTAPVFE